MLRLDEREESKESIDPEELERSWLSEYLLLSVTLCPISTMDLLGAGVLRSGASDEFVGGLSPTDVGDEAMDEEADEDLSR